MTAYQASSMKIIVMADGATDYLFLDKVVEKDPDISKLPISLLRPEEVGLKRRSGGGHKTFIQECGLAAIKAAQGFAEGVLVLVDNDGDDRFKFPHDIRCNNCRECDAWIILNKINWGQAFRKGTVVIYQAIETLLISTRPYFTPQIEDNLFSKSLKIEMYGHEIRSLKETYKAFKQELEKIIPTKIKARSYQRLKKILINICNDF